MPGYCQFCWPRAVDAVATVSEEHLSAPLSLCPAHFTELCVLRLNVTTGWRSDWPGRIRHDLKALAAPVRDH